MARGPARAPGRRPLRRSRQPTLGRSRGFPGELRVAGRPPTPLVAHRCHLAIPRVETARALRHGERRKTGTRTHAPGLGLHHVDWSSELPDALVEVCSRRDLLMARVPTARFEPATSGAERVEVRYVFTFNFH